MGICHSVVTASVERDTACSSASFLILWHHNTNATKSCAIVPCRDTVQPQIGAWRALFGQARDDDVVGGGYRVALAEWAFVARRTIQIQADGGGGRD